MLTYLCSHFATSDACISPGDLLFDGFSGTIEPSRPPSNEFSGAAGVGVRVERGIGIGGEVMT